MRNPKFVNFEEEAGLICGLVAMNEHMTPKDVRFYLDMYRPPLGEKHHVVEMLQQKEFENLIGIAEEVEEDLKRPGLACVELLDKLEAAEARLGAHLRKATYVLVRSRADSNFPRLSR